jgi:serine/threonine protein phosphatase PrpC
MPEVPSGLFTRFFSRSTAPAAPAAPPALVVRAAGRTTVGRRQNNQDALLVRPDLGVFAVADGMGGYEGGEIASTTTIDTLEALYELHRGDGDCTWPHVPDAELSLEAQRAIVAVGLAHRAVRAKREGALAQMGSTIVLATREGRHLVIAHAGDSRAYRVRRGVLTQLTRDHSFLNELEAHRPLTKEDRARMEGQFGHVITKAIGNGEALVPSVAELTLEAGDRYLLCSDGLSGWLSDEELVETLSLHAPETAAEVLVARAYDAGSNDNVTAVVLAVERAA